MKKDGKPFPGRGAAMRSEEDTLGSYTGVNSEDAFEKPVQDADDL